MFLWKKLPSRTPSSQQNQKNKEHSKVQNQSLPPRRNCQRNCRSQYLCNSSNRKDTWNRFLLLVWGRTV